MAPEPESVRDEDLTGATVLAVIKQRWQVSMALVLEDGREVTMIACADSYYTDSDSIWWGTRTEFNDA